MNTPAPNDIQRSREQQALRSVRGLVDTLEDQDALDAHRQRRYLVGIVLGAIAVFILMGVGLWLAQHKENRIIDTAKPSQDRPAKP